MNLTERQLRLFVTTAALGNISRASEVLHLSQPALTRAIATFEEQMGAPLFLRTTRRVVLTPEGETFLPTARRLLQDLENAGSMFSEKGRGVVEHLSMSVGTSFGATVLPRVIAEFLVSHPGVRLRVVDDNSEGITRRVRMGEVDIGIGSPVGDIDALACQRLLSAPLGLLAPPEHFTLTAEDARGVARLPLLKESTDTSIMQLLRVHGSALLAPMAGGVEVSSLAIQLALARAGVGVAVLSALGASHPEAQAMRFVALAPPLYRELFLMRRRDRPLSVAARALEAAIWRQLPQASLHPTIALEQPSGR